MIVFICNHCPYVKAVINRLVSDAKVLIAEGIGFGATAPTMRRPIRRNSFPNMQRFARAHGFPFPYLHDEDQSVARADGAVCTPDFFGYDKERKLRYRGRLDEGRTAHRYPRPRVATSWRPCAPSQPARPPHEQVPSVGCSIKWKAA